MLYPRKKNFQKKIEDDFASQLSIGTTSQFQMVLQINMLHLTSNSDEHEDVGSKSEEIRRFNDVRKV